MVARPIAFHSRVRQPYPVWTHPPACHGRGGARDRLQSPVHAPLPHAWCWRSRTAGTTCFRGGPSMAMLRPPARGGPDTACSEVSRRDEACRIMVERSNGTKLFMGWEGATLLAPHQGSSRDRLQSTVRADEHRRANAASRPDASTKCFRVVGSDAGLGRSTDQAQPVTLRWGRKHATPSTTSPTTCWCSADFHAPET